MAPTRTVTLTQTETQETTAAKPKAKRVTKKKPEQNIEKLHQRGKNFVKKQAIRDELKKAVKKMNSSTGVTADGTNVAAVALEAVIKVLLYNLKKAKLKAKIRYDQDLGDDDEGNEDDMRSEMFQEALKTLRMPIHEAVDHFLA